MKGCETCDTCEHFLGMDVLGTELCDAPDDPLTLEDGSCSLWKGITGMSFIAVLTDIYQTRWFPQDCQPAYSRQGWALSRSWTVRYNVESSRLEIWSTKKKGWMEPWVPTSDDLLAKDWVEVAL